MLREQLGDVVFDRILVKPDLDQFDEDDGEYVEVKATYEGVRERLRSERTSQLRRILRESLLDAGVTEFPVLNLIMKSEWDQHSEPRVTSSPPHDARSKPAGAHLGSRISAGP